eukprot:128760-Pleurochrysis_carterae.AAC.1
MTEGMKRGSTSSDGELLLDSSRADSARSSPRLQPLSSAGSPRPYAFRLSSRFSQRCFERSTADDGAAGMTVIDISAESATESVGGRVVQKGSEQLKEGRLVNERHSELLTVRVTEGASDPSASTPGAALPPAAAGSPAAKTSALRRVSNKSAAVLSTVKYGTIRAAKHVDSSYSHAHDRVIEGSFDVVERQLNSTVVRTFDKLRKQDPWMPAKIIEALTSAWNTVNARARVCSSSMRPACLRFCAACVCVVSSAPALRA